MKRIKNLFILSILTTLSFFFNSCSSSTTITTSRPEPNNAAPLVYEKTSSSINLPIEIKLKGIENTDTK